MTRLTMASAFGLGFFPQKPTLDLGRMQKLKVTAAKNSSRILGVADFTSKAASALATTTHGSATEVSEAIIIDEPDFAVSHAAALIHLGPSITLFKALKPFDRSDFLDTVIRAYRRFETDDNHKNAIFELPAAPVIEPVPEMDFPDSGMLLDELFFMPLDLGDEEVLPEPTSQHQAYELPSLLTSGERLQPDGIANRPQVAPHQDEDDDEWEDMSEDEQFAIGSSSNEAPNSSRQDKSMDLITHAQLHGWKPPRKWWGYRYIWSPSHEEKKEETTFQSPGDDQLPPANEEGISDGQSAQDNEAVQHVEPAADDGNKDISNDEENNGDNSYHTHSATDDRHSPILQGDEKSDSGCYVSSPVATQSVFPSNEPTDYPFYQGGDLQFPWADQSDFLIEKILESGVVPQEFTDNFRETFRAERHGHGPGARIYSIYKETEQTFMVFREVPPPVGFKGSSRLIQTACDECPIRKDFDYLKEFVADCIIPQDRPDQLEWFHENFGAITCGVGLDTYIVVHDYACKFHMALCEARSDPDVGGPSSLAETDLTRICWDLVWRQMHDTPPMPSSPLGGFGSKVQAPEKQVLDAEEQLKAIAAKGSEEAEAELKIANSEHDPFGTYDAWGACTVEYQVDSQGPYHKFLNRKSVTTWAAPESERELDAFLTGGFNAGAEVHTEREAEVFTGKNAELLNGSVPDI